MTMDKFLRNVAISLFVGLTVFICKSSYDRHDYWLVFRANQSFDWIQSPPPNLDTLKMSGLMYYWNSPEVPDTFSRYKLRAKEIPVVVDADTVYLEMVMFDTKYFYESFNTDTLPEGKTSSIEANGWIKTVRDGNRLRFPNKNIIGYAQYDLQADPIFSGNSVYLKEYRDTLYVNSISLGKSSIAFKGVYQSTWKIKRWDIEYRDENMLCDYNHVTGMISNPDSELLVSYHDHEAIDNLDSPHEMVVKDFMIGHVAEEPDYLPAPSVRYKWDDSRIYCDTYLDVVTEDGKILNCNNIYTDYYIKGKPKRQEYGTHVVTLKSTDGFNPFRNGAFVNYKGTFTSVDELEVMCYYKKADGTRVESPRVKAFDVTGINDIQAEPQQTVTPDDGYFYDLTGRRVNPQNLSPGIYIRNGRKFTVTRN